MFTILLTYASPLTLTLALDAFRSYVLQHIPYAVICRDFSFITNGLYPAAVLAILFIFFARHKRDSLITDFSC